MTTKILDAKGLKCPMPIVKAKREIDSMNVGDLLEVQATDPGSVADFQGWVKTSKTATLKGQRTENDPDGSPSIFTCWRGDNCNNDGESQSRRNVQTSPALDRH